MLEPLRPGKFTCAGKPKVLPRYAYGFMASRWGWANESYIESMLTQFRSGAFPIDAWISDFEVSRCMARPASMISRSGLSPICACILVGIF
jgi:alpha-glucosidase (family GH31 glycosyl hydrolase)